MFGCDCRGTGSGVFVEVALPVGTHDYLFIVDGEYKTDPSSPMVSSIVIGERAKRVRHYQG